MRPAGLAIFGDPGSSRIVECDTLQCCHCGKHWIIKPGSGNRRGFCLRCNRPTCGDHRCDKCVPVEQQLTNMENGLPTTHRPIVVPSGFVF